MLCCRLQRVRADRSSIIMSKDESPTVCHFRHAMWVFVIITARAQILQFCSAREFAIIILLHNSYTIDIMNYRKGSVLIIVILLFSLLSAVPYMYNGTPLAFDVLAHQTTTIWAGYY